MVEEAQSTASLGFGGYFGHVLLCMALVCFGGLMSGLTLGLLSMDEVDLEVLIRSGTPTERRQAELVKPARARHTHTHAFCPWHRRRTAGAAVWGRRISWAGLVRRARGSPAAGGACR